MKFLDGPAVGVSLSCHRAPIYLRVVQDTSERRFDALDQPDDTPTPSEIIHVYRRVEGTWGCVFACTRSGRGGGRYEHGDYVHVPVGDTEPFRSTEAWRAWCMGQPEARPTAEDAAAS